MGIMRTIAFVVGLAAVALACSSLPAFSADNGVVAATVTAAAPCITLSNTALAFGPQAFSTASQTKQPTTATSTTVTNCSSNAEKFYAHGTDANGSGGATWANVGGTFDFTCATTNTFNQIIFDSVWGSPNYKALGKSDVDLTVPFVGAKAAGSSETYAFGMTMPCTGSVGAGVEMSFQYVFTAAF
jgi:hypothetical protein